MLSMDVVPANRAGRIGLDVIYAHIETNDVLAAYFGAMHTGKFHGPGMRRSGKTSITSGHHQFT